MELLLQGKSCPTPPGQRATTKSSYRKQGPITTDVTHFITHSPPLLFLLLVCYSHLLLSSPLLTRRLLLPWKGPESQKLLNDNSLVQLLQHGLFALLPSCPSSPRALPASSSKLKLSVALPSAQGLEQWISTPSW